MKTYVALDPDKQYVLLECAWEHQWQACLGDYIDEQFKFMCPMCLNDEIYLMGAHREVVG